MKQVSEGFKARLRQGHTDLARLMTLNLSDGTAYYYTDHDRDIFYSNILFRSDPGITISAIADTVTDGFQDATIELALVDGGITELMVRYGKLGGATFYLERVFYGAVELGTCFDFAGSIRESIVNNRKKLELSVNGAGSLSGGIIIGELYSERCRNVFGDFRCKVDIDAMAVPFSVIAVSSAGNVFYMSILPDLNEGDDTKPIVNEYYYDTATLGRYIYEVPDRRYLDVELYAGGGSVGQFVLSGFAGGNFYFEGSPGGSSGFLQSIAYPGEGGHVGFPIQGVNMRDGYDGEGVNGDAILKGKGGAGGYGEGYPFENDTSRIAVHKGGSGGAVFKRYVVGPFGSTEGDVQVGSLVNFYVGRGGVSGMKETFAGKPGKVKITAVGELQTIDKNKTFGSILWTSGNNIGRISPITNISGQTVTIDYNVGFPIEVGDTGVFRPGCNHYRSDCIKYNNIKNYRGEPDVANYQPKPTVDSKQPPINNGSYLSLPFGYAKPGT